MAVYAPGPKMRLLDGRHFRAMVWAAIGDVPSSFR